MYPDDTRLTFQSQDISQLNEAISDDLKYKQHDLWMQGNKLSLNASKLSQGVSAQNRRIKRLGVHGTTSSYILWERT